ncbi:MAG: hypothetical protein M3Q46_01780 [Verrucomicrobiota bacterium]|nr:hypothetical protein [Verrucomicrobiota bacterium]
MARKTSLVEASAVEAEIEIPDQSDFYKLPARFGAVPLDEAPLGYEVETKRRESKVTKFEHAYPRIYLPFQEVSRVTFGMGKSLRPPSFSRPARTGFSSATTCM